MKLFLDDRDYTGTVGAVRLLLQSSQLGSLVAQHNPIQLGVELV